MKLKLFLFPFLLLILLCGCKSTDSQQLVELQTFSKNDLPKFQNYIQMDEKLTIRDKNTLLIQIHSAQKIIDRNLVYNKKVVTFITPVLYGYGII